MAACVAYAPHLLPSIETSTTMLTSLFSGLNVGTDKTNAHMILVKFDATRDGARMASTIQAYQNGRNNPPAVLTISVGDELPTAFLNSPNVPIRDQDKVDFGRVFLTKMAASNVAVIAAAGNTGTGQPASSVLFTTTPQRRSSQSSQMVTVGAADEEGVRAPFSEFRGTQNNMVSLYNIGTNVLVPLVGQDANGSPLLTTYSYVEGTSVAAPLTAGILSSMMSRDSTINSGNAKQKLIASAQTRKGLNWPADQAGDAVVPRIANDVEVSCTLAAGAQPDAVNVPPWFDFFDGGANLGLWKVSAQSQPLLSDYLLDAPAGVSPFLIVSLATATKALLIPNRLQRAAFSCREASNLHLPRLHFLMRSLT
jgi:subtilisin family serine protease